jgi:hypothetical protein
MKAYSVLLDNSDFSYLVLANSISEVESKLGDKKNNIEEVKLLNYLPNNIIV